MAKEKKEKCTCTVCSGTGRVPCPLCHGEGVIPDPELPRPPEKPAIHWMGKDGALGI